MMRLTLLVTTMIKRYIIIFFLLFAIIAKGQKITVHGYITDLSSGERLLGGSVLAVNFNQGTTSNNYGFYSITIPVTKDSVELQFSFVGYQ